jgi:hypothetical protein
VTHRDQRFGRGWARPEGAPGASLGGDLALADIGSFFVGGRVVRSDHPGSPATGLLAPGDITVDQMYVQYMIPARIGGPPIVLVHGFNHTGATFETTPDGREGWATYFVRKGYPVFIVDQPARGRSGFDPTPINRARSTGDVAALPSIPLYPVAGAWVNFRFGPNYPAPFAALAFPVAALATYTKQLVPSAEGTLADTAAVAERDLALLLDRIGPAVMLGHSQAGRMVLNAVRLRPASTVAMINIEGDCEPTQADLERVFVEVPVLAVFGDNSLGAAGVNGDKRRNGCIEAVKAIRERGGTAEFALLAEHGMPGHSHMLMMDEGNLAIADFIMSWLERSGSSDRFARLSARR